MYLMPLRVPDSLMPLATLQMRFRKMSLSTKVGTLFWSKKPPIVSNSVLSALLCKLRVRQGIEAIRCGLRRTIRLPRLLNRQKCWGMSPRQPILANFRLSKHFFFSFGEQNLQILNIFAQSNQKKSERDPWRNRIGCCPTFFISASDHFLLTKTCQERECLCFHPCVLQRKFVTSFSRFQNRVQTIRSARIMI